MKNESEGSIFQLLLGEIDIIAIDYIDTLNKFEITLILITITHDYGHSLLLLPLLLIVPLVLREDPRLHVAVLHLDVVRLLTYNRVRLRTVQLLLTTLTLRNPTHVHDFLVQLLNRLVLVGQLFNDIPLLVVASPQLLALHRLRPQLMTE